MANPHPLSCLAPQDQLKQLQEVLSSLSLQEEKARASQHHLGQQLNNEAQRSSSLVAQLRAMVAEREAKVRQLEVEIRQLSAQVSRCSRDLHPFPCKSIPRRNPSSFPFLLPAFTQTIPHSTWSALALLPSGLPAPPDSPAHSAHAFPL